MSNIYLNDEEIQIIEKMATKIKKLSPAKRKKTFELFTKFAATQTDEDIKFFVLAVGDFLKKMAQSADVEMKEGSFEEVCREHNLEIVRSLDEMKENK